MEGVETVRWKVVRIVRRRFGGVTPWLERSYYIYQTRIWGSDEGAGLFAFILSDRGSPLCG